MSEKPEAGMPETIHRASKVGLRVLRVVAVRNVSDSCSRSADCGAAADGPGLPERVAEMYGSQERSFRSARGTFVARWKMISQVYRAEVEEDMGARRQLQMVVSPPFRTILTTSYLCPFHDVMVIAGVQRTALERDYKERVAITPQGANTSRSRM